MKKANIKKNLDSLHVSDIYSLMLFLLYKTQDIPEYATLSEICYLLDGNNVNRLLTYFAGKTIKVPTAEEFVILTNALLLYQWVDIEGQDFAEARNRIHGITERQREKITDLYIKILPLIKEYNIDRSQINKYDRQ